jgi:hypothetical protein
LGTIVAGYVGIMARGAVDECRGWYPDGETQAALRRIGERRLAEAKAEGRWTDVVEAARGFDDLIRTGDAAEWRDARMRLTERVRADFEVGRVESCDGWVLARTELDLCARLCLSGVETTADPVLTS